MISKYENNRMKKIKTKEDALSWLSQKNQNHSYCQYEFIDLTTNKISQEPLLKRYQNYSFAVVVNGDFQMVKDEFEIAVPIYHVKGSCFLPRSIQTLKNGPAIVDKNFHVFDVSHLSTLKYGPISVGLDFSVKAANLSNLEHSPLKVGRDFDVSENEISSLLYLTPEIGGAIFLDSNKITSLEYLPEIVHGDLSVSDNQIKTLKNCSKEVNGNFYCSVNQLKNLQYCPEMIQGCFLFFDNEIDSLEFFPKNIEQDDSALSSFVHQLNSYEKSLESNAGLLKFNIQNMDHLDFTYHLDVRLWFSVHHMEKSIKENLKIYQNLDISYSNPKPFKL